MSYQIFKLPKETLFSGGVIQPGWKVSFFLTGLSTPTPVYTSSALSPLSVHTQPVVADSAGVLPVVYLDATIVYKASVYDQNDVLQYTIDPVNDAVLSQSVIGALLYPRTAAEISASVTPTNYAYPPYSRGRYASNADWEAAISAAGATRLFPYNNAIRFPGKVYAVGDSITEGGSGGALGTYPGHLSDLLNDRDDAPYVVSNRGRSGEPAIWIAERFAEDVIALDDASYVIVLAGVNDLRWGSATFSVADIKAALQEMYTAASDQGAIVIACTILPFKDYAGGGDPTKAWDTDKQDNLEEINDWILNTATDVDFRVDTYDAFNDPGDDGRLLAKYDIGDHLHLNGSEAVGPDEDGYAYLAEVIHDAVTWQGAVVSPKLSVTGPHGRINQDVSTDGFPRFIGMRVGGTDGVTGYVSAPRAIYHPTFQVNTGASHTVGLGTNSAFRLLSVSNRGEETFEVGPGNWNAADSIGKITKLNYNRDSSTYVVDNNLAASYDWNIATALKMRLTANGFLGIGGNGAPISTLVISDPDGEAGIEFNPAAGTDLTRMMAYDRVADDTVDLEIIGTSIKLYPDISNAAAWVCSAAGFYPVTDNSVPLGKSGNRPSVIWAASGSISTSDGDKKRKRGHFGLTEAEIAAGLGLSQLVGLYQWRDAIEKKGEGARLHAGPIYQEAWQLFQSLGLDPSNYAIFCEDPATQRVTRTRKVKARRTEQRARVEDYIEVENGRAVIRQRSVTETVPVKVKLEVYTEDGEQVFDAAQVPVLDANGEPEFTVVNGQRVIKTETIKQPRYFDHELFDEIEESYIEEVPTGRTEKGLRHTQLLYFIVAALAAQGLNHDRRPHSRP